MIEAAFTGRLGQDPDLRTSRNGKTWLRLSVAVGTGDETQWVSVAVFEPLATELASNILKGDRLYVEGKLTLNEWQKDGKAVAGLNVAASLVQPVYKIGRNKPKKHKKFSAKKIRAMEHCQAPFDWPGRHDPNYDTGF